MLIASGVKWRRLDGPGIDDLIGAGGYYGPSEALACADSQVVVVRGGN